MTEKQMIVALAILRFHSLKRRSTPSDIAYECKMTSARCRAVCVALLTNGYATIEGKEFKPTKKLSTFFRDMKKMINSQSKFFE